VLKKKTLAGPWPDICAKRRFLVQKDIRKNNLRQAGDKKINPQEGRIIVDAFGMHRRDFELLLF
jgi:hypothetical protein